MKQLDKKKKIILAAGTAAVVILGAILAMPKAPQEEVRQREYPLQKNDIIVGIDSAGAITSEKVGQFVETALQFQEYKVKVGDKVQKGDVVALLSEKDIAEKWKASQEKLASEKAALEKLKNEKQTAKQEADRKIADLRAAGEAAYQEKVRGTAAQKASLEATLEQKNARLAELKQQAEQTQTQKDSRSMRLQEKDTALAALQTEKEELQRRLDALLAETSVDYTQEIAQINLQQSANEQALQTLKKEKETLEQTDYDTLMAAANEEIARLETEIASLTAELNAVNETLKTYAEHREQEKQKENESADLLARQRDIQLTAMDQNIAEAQSKLETTQKQSSELQKYKQDPAVRTEESGVILSLSYKQNSITDATTPVVEIGRQDKKMLRLSVDPSEIMDVSIGQEVSFYVDAYADATFYGKVESKSYLQDEKGKYEVMVSFEPTEQELLEGMGANATLVVKQKLDILTVSNKAILLEDGKSYLLVKNGEELEKRQVTTGFSDGRMTEILEGGKEGEIAVVEERYEEN